MREKSPDFKEAILGREKCAEKKIHWWHTTPIYLRLTNAPTLFTSIFARRVSFSLDSKDERSKDDISRVRKVASYFSSSFRYFFYGRRRISFFSTTSILHYLILQLVGDAIDEFFGRRTGRTG